MTLSMSTVSQRSSDCTRTGGVDDKNARMRSRPAIRLVLRSYGQFNFSCAKKYLEQSGCFNHSERGQGMGRLCKHGAFEVAHRPMANQKFASAAVRPQAPGYVKQKRYDQGFPDGRLVHVHKYTMIALPNLIRLQRMRSSSKNEAVRNWRSHRHDLAVSRTSWSFTGRSRNSRQPLRVSSVYDPEDQGWPRRHGCHEIHPRRGVETR